jgi:hypothetical protein
MMHADRWPPHMRQHVLAGKADCKVMSGDYVESLATCTEAYGPQLHDWPHSLSLLLEVVGRHDDAEELVRTEVSTDELYLYNLRLGRALVAASEGERRILTHDEVRHCKAQAASLAVDTALAESGDAWPLER